MAIRLEQRLTFPSRDCYFIAGALFARNFQAMRFTFCCVRTLEAGIPCAAKRNKPANVVSLRMRAIGNIALCSEVATQVKRPFDRTDCEYLWADHVSVW